MTRIGIFILYFGKLPNNFQIWLNSCKHNHTINWILFTDDNSPFDFPSNVTVHYFSFDEIREQIAANFDFDITLDTPYKLTDYKTAYGEVFQQYVKDFDFWGYCDIDLIFGNIRKFITEEVLNANDKIMTRGHFTLFRNTTCLNRLYRRNILDREPYKKVFADSDFFHFDEWGIDGINRIALYHGIRIFDSPIFHDINYRKYKFYTAQSEGISESHKNNVYLWDKGTLMRYFLSEKQKIVAEEILYLHFQKRKMIVENNDNRSDKVFIKPNKYIMTKGGIDGIAIEKSLNESVPIFDFIKYMFTHIKRKYKI